MIRPQIKTILLALLVGVFAAGCADEVTGVDDIVDLANIEDVAVDVNPATIEVAVAGNLDDTCTTLSDIDVDLTENVFTITMTTIRPGDAVCAQVLVPFTETIILERDGLPAGAYQVVVNGVTEDFVLF